MIQKIKVYLGVFAAIGFLIACLVSDLWVSFRDKRNGVPPSPIA